MFSFEFTAAAGSQFGILSLAVKPDEDGQCPNVVWGKGEGDVQGKDHPVVAESKEGALLSGAQRVVMHGGAPDVSSRLASQGVIDGGDQNVCTKR